MNKDQLKVKDIVEVRQYQRLVDFSADPAQTVAGYFFTDATADLMAKWLDRVGQVNSGNGGAYALAGYRGVGKSHFMATLGALMSHPELRSRITDPLVSSKTHRLMRRHYPVAYVRRGMRNTLIEELKDGLATCLQLRASDLSGSLYELLKGTSEAGGDLPLILLIDTAFERSARVARDDGPFLSQIAEAAKTLNVFVGVALDDDISGADGVNSSIAGSYSIDYLDQEHLYKIVDTYIFPKQDAQAPLHDIYEHFRSVLPGFRWSEQRFSSLYPLHPMVLEVAPFVRLYVHDFALLGFASEAGERILNREATSLIALDEVFDNSEKSLREVPELEEAFAAYDKLNDQVISKVPVMQRLQAKMILKALLMASLDGGGSTAHELCASVLIFDEADPQKAVDKVTGFIDSFAMVLPEDVQRHSEDGSETRYAFRMKSKDSLDLALAAAMERVPEDAANKILRRFMRERFSDCSFTDDKESERYQATDCQIVWRGGFRRGRVTWGPVDEKVNSDLFDWEVAIAEDGADETSTDNGDIPRAVWLPAAVTSEEMTTIRRFHVLQSQADLRDEFTEMVRAALHSHTIAVDKIWERCFLRDAKLLIDGTEHEFPESSRSLHSLSELFSLMLGPLFTSRYPEHPVFSKPLGMTEVSSLVSELFSGAKQNLAEIQLLAETYAAPLGLVTLRDDVYTPETDEKLLTMAIPAEVLKTVNGASGNSVSLKDIYRILRKPPYGLSREAQHLVLTSLVAARQIEFVTSKGDRINRRSLDLKIIWDDIVAVAKPADGVQSGVKLGRWVKVLTGIAGPEAVQNDKDAEAVKAALAQWLVQWREAGTLSRVSGLPENIVNTRIWRLIANLEKTFGSVAETAAAVTEGSMSADEGLKRIADAFSDSEEEFAMRSKDLSSLREFISIARRREEIRSYLSLCDDTGDDAIEALRGRLWKLTESRNFFPGETKGEEMEALWSEFREKFAEKFAYSHDTIMRSHYLQEKYDEILKSDEWWEFENLSAIPALGRQFWQESTRLRREFRQLDCRFDVRDMIKSHPFCACSFRLDRSSYWERLPQVMWEMVNRGLEAYRQTIADNRSELVPMFEEFSRSAGEDQFASAAGNLARLLESTADLPRFSENELKVIRQVCSRLPAAEPGYRRLPSFADGELSPDVIQWITETPELAEK